MKLIINEDETSTVILHTKENKADFIITQVIFNMICNKDMLMKEEINGVITYTYQSQIMDYLVTELLNRV